MALAWKAGWVQALTSSNLVSSATGNCALTRVYTPAGLHLEPQTPDLCVIFALSFAADAPWRALKAGPTGALAAEMSVPDPHPSSTEALTRGAGRPAPVRMTHREPWACGTNRQHD